MGIVIAGVVLALYMPLFELSSVARAARLPMSDRARPRQPHRAAAPDDYSDEVARARKLAERYRLEFVDMDEFRINQELFRSIPADLMLRYGFVPYRRDGNSLVIVVSDPTDLPMIDEVSVVLGTPIKVTVGAADGDSVDSQEERKLAARARGRDAGLPAAGPEGRRSGRGQPDGRAAHERHQPDHQAGGLDDLHRHPAPGQRHPHRDGRRRGAT